MGQLLACKLERIGLIPVLVTRTGPPGQVVLTLREGEEETRHHIPTVGADVLGRRAVQCLFVTTKANQAMDAVSDLTLTLAPGAKVILLHNGMGVLERLQTAYPYIEILAGTTTEGAYIDGDILVHAGKGDTVIGGRDKAPDWFWPLARSDERFSWEPDIDDALWKKLLINCAINPLTALHRCRNGVLLSNPALRAELEMLCEELAAVSAARGNARGASCALDWALAVAQQTATNQSSMLQDVERGRETEIRYITGYLVSEAERLGVPCPHNARLLAQLDSGHASN